MVYKIFDKKISGSGIENENISNKESVKELHKPIIKKVKKIEVHSFFKDHILSTDLADMQLISKCNSGFRFLLFAIDIYSKYACLIPLKDQKGIPISNDFQKVFK